MSDDLNWLKVQRISEDPSRPFIDIRTGQASWEVLSKTDDVCPTDALKEDNERP